MTFDLPMRRGAASATATDPAVAHSNATVGALLSGRTLGEAILYTDQGGLGSGLFYGDPLHRPIGVDLWFTEETGEAIHFPPPSWSCDRFWESKQMRMRDRAAIGVAITAFNGHDFGDETRWSVRACGADDTALECASPWVDLFEGDTAVFERHLGTLTRADLAGLGSAAGTYLFQLDVWQERDGETTPPISSIVSLRTTDQRLPCP